MNAVKLDFFLRDGCDVVVGGRVRGRIAGWGDRYAYSVDAGPQSKCADPKEALARIVKALAPDIADALIEEQARAA